jgi:outer membrane protein
LGFKGTKSPWRYGSNAPINKKKEYLYKNFQKPLKIQYFMKNLSLILNGVLIIAVGVLYYLHFFTAPHKAAEARPDSTRAVTGVPIVFINIDTLLNNYDYYQDLRMEMEDKQAELEAQLNAQSKTYEKNAIDYQDKVSKGLLTRREAAEIEQALYQEQQNLLALRDQLAMQLQEEEQVRNRRLIDNIMVFLRDYNKDYHYQFIFSNSFGDNMLFASDSLNITYPVLQGINKKYREDQAANK